MKAGDKWKIGPSGYRKEHTITGFDGQEVRLYCEFDETSMVVSREEWEELRACRQAIGPENHPTDGNVE